MRLIGGFHRNFPWNLVAYRDAIAHHKNLDIGEDNLPIFVSECIFDKETVFASGIQTDRLSYPMWQSRKLLLLRADAKPAHEIDVIAFNRGQKARLVKTFES